MGLLYGDILEITITPYKNQNVIGVAEWERGNFGGTPTTEHQSYFFAVKLMEMDYISFVLSLLRLRTPKSFPRSHSATPISFDVYYI